jgi:hypothetical protein
MRRLGSPTWIAPGLFWPTREGNLAKDNKPFHSLVQKFPDLKQHDSKSENSLL